MSPFTPPNHSDEPVSYKPDVGIKINQQAFHLDVDRLDRI